MLSGFIPAVWEAARAVLQKEEMHLREVSPSLGSSVVLVGHGDKQDPHLVSAP